MRIAETTLPVLTRVDLARYAGAIGDFNPMHLDDELARSLGLPSVIAHGPLTVARGIEVVARTYGANAFRDLDARLRAPYFPGNTLIVSSSDRGLELRSGSGTVLATAKVSLADDASSGGQHDRYRSDNSSLHT